MITVREYDSKTDHEEVCRWWLKQEWPALPSWMLPRGYVAVSQDSEGQEILLAAAFLYENETNFFIMEWIVGNPDVSWEIRGEGIEQAVRACVARAKSRGATTIITTTKHQRLIDRYLTMGFKTGDEGMTHLILGIKDLKVTAPSGQNTKEN